LSRAPERPAWLDPGLYPFTSHWAELGPGRLHYLDEGHGPPVVFVHGAPTWSFLWRDPVGRLRERRRCIAPDLLGFGLSERPAGFSYRPREQAALLGALLERLDVRDATLVVHDWGGPIGLAWALDHPGRVSSLVILNSWLWSVRGDLRGELTGRLFASRLWTLLERRLALSTRVFLPAVAGERPLPPAVRRHYAAPFEAGSRLPIEVLWREILRSHEWLAGLWARRERLAGLPALVVWGLRDRAFTPRDLARFEAWLPGARVLRLPRAGHWVPEEAPAELGAALEEFLGGAAHSSQR
jgi:haloalkane dehalogenase